MKQKVIIISGGSDGLGKGIAKELVHLKHKVIILARNEARLKRVSKQLKSDYRVCDVSDAAQCEDAVNSIHKQYKRIDVLVNNAGCITNEPLEKEDPKTIENVFGANTLGTIFLTRAVLPFMKKKKSGDVFCVVSRAGVTVKKHRTIYNSSKWAITGFVKCLREDVAEDNIRVMAIYPGTINTNIFEKAGDKMKSRKTVLQVKEVVNVICFMIAQPGHVQIADVGMNYLGR